MHHATEQQTRTLLYSISCILCVVCFFFFSSRRRHTRSLCDWSSDVCSSDLYGIAAENEVVSKCLHCQYANVVFQENRQDLMLKTAELVAVHDIKRELDRLKTKAVIGSRL